MNRPVRDHNGQAGAMFTASLTGAALAHKEHLNSIRRCFKHGCAGRILPFAGPMEDRSGCRSDTHRCRVPTRHLWG